MPQVPWYWNGKRRTTGYFYFGIESKDNDDGKRPVRSKGSSLDNLYNEILPDVCEKRS